MTLPPDLSVACWSKSSYSGSGGQCVEMALNLVQMHGVVPVRDSKDPQGPALVFTTADFDTFVTALKSGWFGEV
ncbi:DUF397 domain-containing protein [Kitasatospora sp. NA04385]|uniref:DUF397 domain-containing protein n=1 Tax=Kitasatospora sp. NA04385 TaxID=2742135 RepID=UPI001591CEA2|nr:DUF397 domain-containing protein [Kitasatospora sp. NA04385]QKW20406.1 DUF397 domain-containing protein [Kitasatospora sp. NA04385]